MRRVLFSGYYGQGNAGDDVFCSVAALLRNRAEVDYDPWFLAWTLPLLASESVPVHQRLPSWLPSRVRISSSAVACHNVVQFGGSTLQRLNPTRTVLLRLAQSRLIRLSAIGVSVGPFASHGDAADVRAFLGSCKEVVVRDQRSLTAASELGVSPTLGFDPAVLLRELIGRGQSPEQTTAAPIIGVSISAAGLDEPQGVNYLGPRFTRLASLVRGAHNRTGAEIRVINMQSNSRDGDDRATAWLVEQLKECRGVSLHTHSGDVVQTFEAIRGCTVVVGVRLHSCILAYAAGVPFVQIDYHAKCRDFLETVGAQCARAESTLDNLDEVAQMLDLAIAGRWPKPTVAAADAASRCLAALGATRIWHGVDYVGSRR